MSSSSDNAFQTNQLPISVEYPIDPNLLQVVNTETYKRTANAVNTKVSGLYLPQETASFKQYFSTSNPMQNRDVYRKVIDFGTLPNTGTKTVAHGIAFDASCTLTHLYATATDPIALTYFEIPYASPTLANNIELFLDSTNVTIITGSNRTAFTICYVVIEWLKN